MAINVLVVDDSPATRNIIGRVLKLSGLDISSRYEAENGIAGLRVLRESQVDVVLTDINMPEMDGESFVRELANDPTLNAIPVIVVSTDGTDTRVERMRQLGAKGYIRKPFRPETIGNEVNRVLGLSNDQEV